MPTSETPVFLSIIIPAFNEEDRLGATLRTILAYLESRPESSEIIVVDDGCTDRTCDIAAEILARRPGDRILRRAENRGKGYSVREGVLASRGGLILFSDADLSTPITEFEKLQARILAGDDIVIGSRALPDSDIRRRQKRFRELMGKMFNLFVRIFVLKGIRDTQCGFKLFRREAALDVFPRLWTRGFGFDVEALYLARRLGYRIGQVPVVWANSPQSKVRIIGSSVGMIRELLRIKRLHRNLKTHEKK
jgi:dolichyl-phosphate beta-glucosyltransferase